MKRMWRVIIAGKEYETGSYSISASMQPKQHVTGYVTRPNGNKFHILKVLCRAGNPSEVQGAMALLQDLTDTLWQRLELIWADDGYRGDFEAWVADTFDVSLDIMLCSDGVTGFEVMP